MEIERALLLLLYSLKAREGANSANMELFREISFSCTTQSNPKGDEEENIELPLFSSWLEEVQRGTGFV